MKTRDARCRQHIHCQRCPISVAEGVNKSSDLSMKSESLHREVWRSVGTKFTPVRRQHQYLAAPNLTHAGLSLSVFDDHVRCLLADHVNRRDDEKAWDAGEDRGVDDAQALRADDAEAAVDHRVGVVGPAHLATA